jgi:hypothetical protein
VMYFTEGFLKRIPLLGSSGASRIFATRYPETKVLLRQTARSLALFILNILCILESDDGVEVQPPKKFYFVLV